MESWLVTGAAGFIGSHVVSSLLKSGRKVTGIDNFFKPPTEHNNFTWFHRDLLDKNSCYEAAAGADVVIHLAAHSSVPYSLENPAITFENNVTGFNNMIEAGAREGVKRFVYASSSAVYGDDTSATKIENLIGKPLSPYAASKRINEIVAESYHHSFGLATVGLRYFNIFGPRMHPDGAYASVIAKWISALMKGEEPEVYGEGKVITRDFCYVSNAVDAAILAAEARPEVVGGKVYNIGTGNDVSLDTVFKSILWTFDALGIPVKHRELKRMDWRKGDIPCSMADIARAEEALGYRPVIPGPQGILDTVKWYQKEFKK